jgi:elongation factor 2
LLEKDVEKEAIYQSLKRTIDNINASISSFPNPLLGDAQVFPERGNVAFTSGLHGCAFTLRQFARRYANQFGIEEERTLRKLWGEIYFNRATRKWTSMGTDANGEPLECAFNMFVLDPISVIVYLCFADRTYNLLTYDQRSAP